MADPSAFPDLLGTITGGPRLNVNVIQAAVGARPATVQPGRPFELLLLLQNASDTRVDVAAQLHLPKQFQGKEGRLVTTLAAGEVGYVSLPVAALTTTSAGAYKLGVEIDVKSPPGTTGKLRRVREAAGSGGDLSTLRQDKVALIDALKQVAFSTSKRMVGNVIDVAVEVGKSQTAERTAAPPAGWMSLWTMADLKDERLLLHYFGETLRLRVLSQLQRQDTLKPLTQAVEARFSGAGYPIQPAETLMIAKLMALILEYAAPRDNAHDPIRAGRYDLTGFLSGSSHDIQMPRWMRGMLRLIARDERVATQAVNAVTKMLFNELLWDATMLGFSLVETATGEDVGNEREMVEYATRLLKSLNTTGELDFVHTYMPLILGGIVINDQLPTEDSNLVEALRQLWVIVDDRRMEVDENAEPVVEIAEQLIERALQAYGYRRGST